MKKFLITGGAGFIGSAIVRHLIQKTEHSVFVDLLKNFAQAHTPFSFPSRKTTSSPTFILDEYS